MRSRAWVHALCIVSTCVLCDMAGCAHGGADRSGPAASTSSPAGLLDLDGRPFDLAKKQPAAITVVVFTRTDCPISNRFAPEIRQLHEKYHPQGVDFFLVYVDPHEQPEAIRRHLREYAYPCQGLRDPNHALVAQTHATITPEAVVFDRHQSMTYRGRISDLYVDLGQARAEATTHDLADAIEATLLGRPVAAPRTAAIGCVIADLAR